jgi:hypothetical protein
MAGKERFVEFVEYAVGYGCDETFSFQSCSFDADVARSFYGIGLLLEIVDDISYCPVDAPS